MQKVKKKETNMILILRNNKHMTVTLMDGWILENPVVYFVTLNQTSPCSLEL
jgi:hypothetical protein